MDIFDEALEITRRIVEGIEYDCLTCQDTGRVLQADSPLGWAACEECTRPNHPQEYP